MDKCEKVPKLQRFRSEEEFAQTWDRCITDMIVKMGGGVGLGIVFSVFLFGRRGWPIYFGMGTGFGIAYNNCQTAFNGALQNHRSRPRCSPQIQLAKRRPEKIDPSKRGGSRPLVLECIEEPVQHVVQACEMPKREEPWTAHNTLGQVTDHGIYNVTHPHFNTVGHSQQTIPPCPPDECPPPPLCETNCSTDPRDSCRFKTRM